MTPEKQPKVVHKLLVRTLILVLVLGGILLAIQSGRNKDARRAEKADTVGWISAVEYKGEGTEAVAVKPDRSIVRSEGWKSGAQDRDLVWAPNGNFLFFISDRTENGFHVYRWNPQRPDAEVRTLGTRGRSNPTFKLKQEANDLSMLMTSGGLVMEFDPSDRLQTQVLPPTGREIPVGDGEEAGAQSQFSAMYGQLGNSFRYARWCGDDDHIAAIMRRDEGEVLLVQSMNPSATGEFEQPLVIAAGDRIEFDVSPKDGSVVYAVNEFAWHVPAPKEFVTNGKVRKPFAHYVGLWKKGDQSGVPVVANPDNTNAFGSPAIHPSGDTFVVAVGPYRDGAIARQGLISFPVKANAGGEAKMLVRGDVYEPSWDPTGSLLVYAKREGENRTLYTISSDGSSERSITSAGRFGFPRFSPQTK